MVRVKLSTSAGSGKSVFMVFGSSSSVRSGSIEKRVVSPGSASARRKKAPDYLPFWTRSCAGEVLGFFFFADSSSFFMLQIYRGRPNKGHVVSGGWFR
jgi:hypothetical protein